MSRAATGRSFYRSRVSNTIVCLICSLGTIALMQMTVQNLRTNGSVALAAFGGVLSLVFLVPAVREPFHGVVATSSGIRVRNVLRTHVLRWDEIDHFEVGRYDPWPQIGVVVLVTGRKVPMVGVQKTAAGSFADRTVAELNLRLAAARARSPG